MCALRRILEALAAVSKVPKVMVKTDKWAGLALVLGCIATFAAGQQPAPPATSGPAESLYLKLRSVGLDNARVYKIRDASLDRGNLHISLDDGIIAFTQDVGGHITGAFYKGYGEALLSPPNTMERSSLALFTGAAILEETFSTAYFRFNDDVYGELQPSFRTAEDPAGFVSDWNNTAVNLAAEDSLRLLISLCDFLPSSQQNAPPQANDHLLHAYLEGNKLGLFDVRYDSLGFEQIQAGQHKRVEGLDYYDLWTSFAIPALPHTKADRGAAEASNFGFDVTNFKIDAEIKPDKELDAKAVLNIVSRQEGRRALLFELSRLLHLSEVRANGQPVEFIHNQAIEGSQLARRGNDVVAVILPAALHGGQKAELTFAYSGSVLSEAANGLLYVGERGNWYPNRGFAPASFDMEFRYPLGWTLVATGRRTEEHATGAQQSSRWVSERPVPVAGFNLGKYSQQVTHAGKVTVLTYATANVERGFAGTGNRPEPDVPAFLRPRAGVSLNLAPPPPLPEPSRNAQMVGAASARAVEFYARHFGAFPFSELSITQMPGRVSQGWPGLIFLSSYSFLNQRQQEQLQVGNGRQLSSEEVIAHETAHQWWGDLVTWNSYRDQWIMEGLANYSALMLLESHDPAKFREVMQNYRDELLTKNHNGVSPMDAGPVTLGLRLSSSKFPDAYTAICYGRGTWLFHMLRTMLNDAERKSSPGGARSKTAGEEPFMRALKKLRTDYEGRDVSMPELMKVFEAALPPSLWYEGHKSLDWFYEYWVNGNAIPQVELHGVKFTDKGTATLVSGTLTQQHAPDNLVTSVPLFVPGAGKNIFLARVFAEGSETQFHISAPAGTRKLVLDPEGSLLARGK